MEGLSLVSVIGAMSSRPNYVDSQFHMSLYGNTWGTFGNELVPLLQEDRKRSPCDQSHTSLKILCRVDVLRLGNRRPKKEEEAIGAKENAMKRDVDSMFFKLRTKICPAKSIVEKIQNKD